MLDNEDGIDLKPAGGPTRDELLQKIAALGVNPFLQPIVHNPWQTVVDAESLHGKQKKLIRELLGNCAKSPPRCLTFVAPGGFGKTHLLACTRQSIDQTDNAIFVYVPPYVGGNTPPDQHLLHAAIDAIWLRSQKKRNNFEAATRKVLVGCYDGLVGSTPRVVKDVLRAGTFWSRLFRRSKLRIGQRSPQEQAVALQRAFGRRGFLQHAFADFEERHPPDVSGLRADWDTFVAGCLLACGDTKQRWHADRWFRGDQIPPDVLEPYHITSPLSGTDKVLNSLFTLSRLGDSDFCFAFDQMETTYSSLEQSGQNANQFKQMLATLVFMLCTTPRIALLFMFQVDIWEDFRKAYPSLTARMIEGNKGEKPQLQPLDDATAEELVGCRMQALIWNHLDSIGPPKTEPCFPFTPKMIRQLRRDSENDLRAFLQLTKKQFDSFLQGEVPPRPRPRIQLTGISPREVMSHEATAIVITGRELPPDVEVFFADVPVSTPITCRPAEGAIDVTTPVGLLGDVQVKVQAANEPENYDCVSLRFERRAPRRPYCKHIDRVRLKARREAIPLTQKVVGEKVGYNQWKISNLETGRWTDAPDDLYDCLAALYGMPLSAFLKQPS